MAEKLLMALPEYLIRYLNSLASLTELRRNAKHAVNQSSINQQDVAHVGVSLPSIEEQAEIIRRVEALFALADRIEARVQAATVQVEKITLAILAKAFRGELVPTEAELARAEGRTYEPASVLLERIRAARAADDTSKSKRTNRRARRKSKA
ncbi:MAG: restriction endonuclease subunit S [Candidatus Thorarchaeota archaeon]